MSLATGRPWFRRWFGSRSERAGARFLKRQGYRILSRNFSNAVGELDIVALDDRCIVFVEVRSTEDGTLSGRAESVDREKQRRLTRVGLSYLQEKRLLELPARFDVLLVRWPASQKEPEIEHLRHAFEAAGKFQMHS